MRFATVKSAAVGRRADVSVWAPPADATNGPLPLVLLLHGVYGSAWSWPLRGGAHLTAARLIEAGEIPPLALAMPSDGMWGDGSGYIAHADADYESWIVDEVPEVAALVDDRLNARAPRFIAGLSMGGFGALRLGAKYAACFAGISAHSAVTAIARFGSAIAEPLDSLPSFGAPDGTALHWLETNAARLPPVRFDCGADDPVLPANRALHAALDARAIPHTYEEFPGGHDWLYWRLHLADTLRFFGGIAAEMSARPPAS